MANHSVEHHPLTVYRHEKTLQIHVPIIPVDSQHAASKHYVDFGGGASTTTTIVGPGPIPLTVTLAQLSATVTGTAYTLADGALNQRMVAVLIAEVAGADTAVITPANLLGAATTITLNGIGDAIELVMATGGWAAIGGSGVLA